MRHAKAVITSAILAFGVGNGPDAQAERERAPKTVLRSVTRSIDKLAFPSELKREALSRIDSLALSKATHATVDKTNGQLSVRDGASKLIEVNDKAKIPFVRVGGNAFNWFSARRLTKNVFVVDSAADEVPAIIQRKGSKVLTSLFRGRVDQSSLEQLQAALKKGASVDGALEQAGLQINPNGWY